MLCILVSFAQAMAPTTADDLLWKACLYKNQALAQEALERGASVSIKRLLYWSAQHAIFDCTILMAAALEYHDSMSDEHYYPNLAFFSFIARQPTINIHECNALNQNAANVISRQAGYTSPEHLQTYQAMQVILAELGLPQTPLLPLVRQHAFRIAQEESQRSEIESTFCNYAARVPSLVAIDPEHQCSICLTPLHTNNKEAAAAEFTEGTVIVLQCSHQLHAHCYNSYLNFHIQQRQSTLCPLCRQPVVAWYSTVTRKNSNQETQTSEETDTNQQVSRFKRQRSL